VIQAVLGGVAFAVLFAAVIEAVVLACSRQGYDWRAALTSLALALLRQMTELVPLGFVIPGGQWLFAHRLFEPRSLLVRCVLLFAGLELAQYAIHRLSHRVRWFWATHAVHHTARELNLTVGYRLGFTGRFTFGLALLAPLCALGFSPELVATGFSLHVLYQFWIHAGWAPRLGPLEGIFNTPSAHRVHHATHAEYREKNFGGVTVIFDRLFGTYAPERADLPLEYGHGEASQNPLSLGLREWGALLRDVRAATGWRARARCLFGPPTTS
jgi:sterol desaturase/sphingolipid hydroxylase (fatty acid hydroxylase superfamily)